MPATDEKLKLSPKPYLSTTAAFAGGNDTPRDFLERCLADLDRLEPQIGAFVHLSLNAARVAADQSTERWRDGKPLSQIDGMPVGIKDIIETIDMPTEKGSPLFAGWRSGRDAASVAALREAGAVIVGKTVTTEFAASEPRGTRNPWDLGRTPGRLEQRLGGRRRGRHGQPGARHAGGRLDHPSGELLRLLRLQAERRRDQSRRQPRRLEPELPPACWPPTLEDAWQVAYEIAQRAGGDPGYPGLYGPASVPAAQKPRRIALLETAGWAAASRRRQGRRWTTRSSG